MDRVAAEVTQEIGVFFQDQDLDPGARQQKPQHHAGGAAAGDDYASHSVYERAAFTRSGLSGARRNRTPVALKKALATAPGMTRIVGSPAPEGATSGRLISVTSIDYGASAISRIG